MWKLILLLLLPAVISAQMVVETIPQGTDSLRLTFDIDGLIILKLDDTLAADELEMKLDSDHGVLSYLLKGPDKDGVTQISFSKKSLESSSTLLKPLFTLTFLTIGLCLPVPKALTLVFALVLFSCSVFAETNSSITILISPNAPIRTLQLKTLDDDEVVFIGDFDAEAAFSTNCLDTPCFPLLCNASSTNCFSKNERVELVVASIFPASGDSQSISVQIQSGVGEALTSLGQLYPTIRVVQVDSGRSFEQWISAFQTCYEQGVRVFIAASTSEEAEVILSWVQENAPDVIVFSPSATAPSLSKYSQLFRMSMDNTQLALALQTMLSSIHEQETLVLPLIRNDTFARELVSAVKASRGLRMLDPVIYAADSITSAQDAKTVIAQLEAAVSSTGATVIMPVAFDEIRFLLESSTPAVQRLPWIGAGYSDSPAVMRSAEALSAARKVNLSSIQYYASNTESTRIARNDFLASMAQQFQTATPYAACAYDSLILIYTIARLHQSGEVDILRDFIVTESEFIYGLSGHLQFNRELQNRQAGEFYRSHVVPHPGPLDLVWDIVSFTYVDLNREDNQQTATVNAGAIVFTEETLDLCDSIEISMLQGGWIWKTITIDNPTTGLFPLQISVLDDLVIVSRGCDFGADVRVNCPSGRAGALVGCQVSYQDTSNGKRGITWATLSYAFGCTLSPASSILALASCTKATWDVIQFQCYGHFCGLASFCDGQSQFDPSDSGQSCNNLDDCCRQHDLCYGDYPNGKCNCDDELQTCLNSINTVGNFKCGAAFDGIGEAYLRAARTLGVPALKAFHC